VFADTLYGDTYSDSGTLTQAGGGKTRSASFNLSEIRDTASRSRTYEYFNRPRTDGYSRGRSNSTVRETKHSTYSDVGTYDDVNGAIERHGDFQQQTDIVTDTITFSTENGRSQDTVQPSDPSESSYTVTTTSSETVNMTEHKEVSSTDNGHYDLDANGKTTTGTRTKDPTVDARTRTVKTGSRTDPTSSESFLSTATQFLNSIGDETRNYTETPTSYTDSGTAHLEQDLTTYEIEFSWSTSTEVNVGTHRRFATTITRSGLDKEEDRDVGLSVSTAMPEPSDVDVDESITNYDTKETTFQIVITVGSGPVSEDGKEGTYTFLDVDTTSTKYDSSGTADTGKEGFDNVTTSRNWQNERGTKDPPPAGSFGLANYTLSVYDYERDTYKASHNFSQGGAVASGGKFKDTNNANGNSRERVWMNASQYNGAAESQPTQMDVTRVSDTENVDYTYQYTDNGTYSGKKLANGSFENTTGSFTGNSSNKRVYNYDQYTEVYWPTPWGSDEFEKFHDFGFENKTVTGEESGSYAPNTRSNDVTITTTVRAEDKLIGRTFYYAGDPCDYSRGRATIEVYNRVDITIHAVDGALDDATSSASAWQHGYERWVTDVYVGCAFEETIINYQDLTGAPGTPPRTGGGVSAPVEHTSVGVAAWNGFWTGAKAGGLTVVDAFTPDFLVDVKEAKANAWAAAGLQGTWTQTISEFSAGVAVQAVTTAATMGVGNAITAARCGTTTMALLKGTNAAITAYDVYDGAKSVVTGIQRVANGDKWGYLDIALGTLSVGSTASGLRNFGRGACFVAGTQVVMADSSGRTVTLVQAGIVDHPDLQAKADRNWALGVFIIASTASALMAISYVVPPRRRREQFNDDALAALFDEDDSVDGPIPNPELDAVARSLNLKAGHNAWHDSWESLARTSWHAADDEHTPGPLPARWQDSSPLSPESSAAVALLEDPARDAVGTDCAMPRAGENQTTYMSPKLKRGNTPHPSLALYDGLSRPSTPKNNRFARALEGHRTREDGVQHSQNHTPRSRPTSRFGAREIALLVLLAVTGVFGLAAWSERGGEGLALWDAALVPVTSVERPLRTKSIEDIRVGDRVVADNPDRRDVDPSAAEPNPATWRRIELQAPKVDGSVARVVLLRPVEWLEARGARAGGTVHIAVPECGIDGNATVLSIGHCPPIAEGSGCVVTGTYGHSSAEIVDLYVEGESEPIGTTANHPFWSEDRHEFVRADQLWPGERLNTLDGTVRLTNRVPRGPPQPVYNIEVQAEHVYRVAQSGVLVHNARDCSSLAPGRGTRVFHGTDSASSRSIHTRGLDVDEARRAAGGAGIDDKGFSVTTNLDDAQAWAKARAMERGGRPVVLEADAGNLPLRSGDLDNLADPDEFYIDLDDYTGVGSGVFSPLD